MSSDIVATWRAVERSSVRTLTVGCTWSEMATQHGTSSCGLCCGRYGRQKQLLLTRRTLVVRPRNHQKRSARKLQSNNPGTVVMSRKDQLNLHPKRLTRLSCLHDHFCSLHCSCFFCVVVCRVVVHCCSYMCALHVFCLATL